MWLEPRGHIRCHVCGEVVDDRDFGKVCWRFAVPTRCLASAQVCHDACWDPSEFPYYCTLRDYIELGDLFRGYFSTYILDGLMTEQPVWDVATRIFHCLDRHAYFRFDREAYERYFHTLHSAVAQGS